jgi:hypothetical protein
MNQTERRLSNALRRLGALAPDGAPPALGDILKDEFRRHHVHRKRKRAARISLLAACLVASVVLSIILRPRSSNTGAAHEHPQTPQPSQPVSAGLLVPNVSRPPAVEKTRPPVRTRNSPATTADRFVALPTFDPAIPIDHSEMVRLDLPGRALRLVGFPVNEEIADRRVVADVLLAQDGTPYALRLVQNSPMKEH